MIPFALPPPASRAARLVNMIATWLAVILLASSALLARAYLRSDQVSDALADQVTVVQLASEKMLSSLKDAETGQRGFLLTDDPAYLEPYTAARARLNADFARVESAPLATPERTARLRRIRALAEEKMDELGRTLALHDAGQAEAALRLVRTNQGQQTMDAIRAEVDGLQSSTDATLIQARSATDPTWNLAAVVGLGAAACVLLGGVVAAQRRMQRYVESRLYRLQRFTKAFGLAQGTLRDLDGRILFWDTGAQRLYGYSAEEALGKICRHLLHTQFPQPLKEIAAALLRDGVWQGELICRHRDGRELNVVTQWALSRGEAGEPDVVIEVSNDITSGKLAEQERQRANALLQTFVETAPGLIYAKDRQGRMMLANASTLDLIGKPWAEVEGRTDVELLDDRVQAEHVMLNDRRIMEQEENEEFEEVVGTHNSQPRVWSSTKAPLRDGNGMVIGLVGVSIEITERKRIEDRLHLMVNELNHRVKNTLATVQAIASQTLRGGDPILGQKLEGRLMALAAAHDVLTREQWQGAGLDDVMTGALAPFGGREDGRFTVSGPSLRLLPRAALALAMGLHELATNALKHGALSAASGQVEIRWEIIKNPQPELRLTWTERGGPPISAPSKRGFGIRLVERSLAQDLGGTASVTFDNPDGVVSLIEAPLAEMLASAEVVALPRVGGGKMGSLA